MFHFHRIATTSKHRSHVFRSRTIGDRTGAESTTAESDDRNDGDMAERWRRATVIWQKRETITVKVNRWEPPPVTGS